MLAIPGAALCFALARLVGLRRSRPRLHAPTHLPGTRNLIRWDTPHLAGARIATATGGLTLSGTLLDGVLFGIATLLDLRHQQVLRGAGR